MLNALAKSRCPIQALHGLARELIREGEAARAWIAAGKANDPNERRRSSDSAFLQEVKKIPTLARRLASHVECEQSEFALVEAMRSSRTRIISLEESPTLRGTVLAKLLRAYAQVLPRLHTARGGPFLHRTVIGPFVFPKAVDGRAARRGASIFEPSTAVMFSAVLAARQATTGVSGQDGNLMPKTGKPLYAVAAALVKAVTGDVVTGEEVRIRLKDWITRNPKVGWIDWPDRGA